MAESEIHLEPNPSFDWSRVLWGAPNATISDDCSYCEACIPEDAVPLRLWNEAGWGAQFCDACMTKYWGFSPGQNALAGMM